MISDPKLPFAGEPSGVGTSAEAPPGLSAGNGAVPPEGSTVPRRHTSAARLWLRRVGVLLFVFLCATLGVMLMIVPWRPEWSENPLLMRYPAVRDALSTGFVRGLVTGLGLLNVWIGFWEALQYHED